MLLSEGALWQGKDRSAACVPCTETCSGSDRRAMLKEMSRVKMTQEPVGVTVNGLVWSNIAVPFLLPSYIYMIIAWSTLATSNPSQHKS